ncbi:hypothetical protein [Saccharicrinis sp. GN24d3]|uniref:hypothetical protein n=1 Tax=Saccharicrinis sp. GN24d3 TaxID=3458416 RepID=UPI0040351E44
MKANTCLKSFFLTIILIGASFTSRAQIDLSHRYTFAEFDTSATGKLYFRIENNNFVKNNEYFGEYTEGYTLPGYSIQPSLMYYAGKNVRLQVGAHLVKYSGIKDFSEFVPVVSAYVKLGKKWDMILGNIKGDVHHRLIEPLFNPEWQYLRPTETGVQFFHQSERLWLDTWIDWEQFIFHGDEIPEKFTGGISLDYKITQPEARFNLSIPFQMTAFHLGGQISDYLTESYSLINLLSGFKVSQQIDGAFIKKISLATYFCSYNDLTDARTFPFNKGGAIYPTGILTYKHGEIMAGYWNASNFFAPKGSALFYSVSDYKLDYYTKKRQIITAKFTYHKTLMKQVKFNAQVESYYDVEASALEYAYGISLVFTPNFFITKLDFE